MVCPTDCRHVFILQKPLNGGGPVLGGDSSRPKKHYTRRRSEFPHKFDAAVAKLLWPLVYYLLMQVEASYPFEWFALRQIDAEILSLVNQLFELGSACHVCSLQTSQGFTLKLFHILVQFL